jgi:hypothetical protein
MTADPMSLVEALRLAIQKIRYDSTPTSTYGRAGDVLEQHVTDLRVIADSAAPLLAAPTATTGAAEDPEANCECGHARWAHRPNDGACRVCDECPRFRDAERDAVQNDARRHVEARAAAGWCDCCQVEPCECAPAPASDCNTPGPCMARGCAGFCHTAHLPR